MAVTFLFEDEERLDWASDGITSYLYYVFLDASTILGWDRTSECASRLFELNQCRVTAAAVFVLIGLFSGCSTDGDFEEGSKTRSIGRLVDSGFHRYDPTRPHLSTATT